MKKTSITIGRDKTNDICIFEECKSVSRHHCEIICEDGVLWINDFSTNGSKINGHHIHNEKHKLQEGDIIILGNDSKLEWNIINKHIPCIDKPNKQNYNNDEDIAFIPIEEVKGLIITHIPQKKMYSTVMLGFYSNKKIEKNINPIIGDNRYKAINGKEKLRHMIEEFNDLSIKKNLELNRIPASHILSQTNDDIVIISVYNQDGEYIQGFWTEQINGEYTGNLAITGKDLHEHFCRINKQYKYLNSWIESLWSYLLILGIVIAVMIYLSR